MRRTVRNHEAGQENTDVDVLRHKRTGRRAVAKGGEEVNPPKGLLGKVDHFFLAQEDDQLLKRHALGVFLGGSVFHVIRDDTMSSLGRESVPPVVLDAAGSLRPMHGSWHVVACFWFWVREENYK